MPVPDRVQDFAQGLAFHKFHDHVAACVASSDIVNRDDIRMIERGCRAGFTLEPPHAIGIQPVAVGEHFDGYTSFQPLVAGEINFTHTPGAQRGQNFVANRERGR